MISIKAKMHLLNGLQQFMHRQAANMSSKVYPKKIVSGIQPTGAIHLGNYFGAIKRWVDLQESDDSVFFIADLHAMTMPYEPKQLTDNIFELTATLLACGIDPNKSTLFLQSTVHQHTELSWIFNCLTTMNRLSQLPQFKEKAEQAKIACTGLFMYPVLQAADILLHKGTHVPCGEDQVQQLQLAQHLARLFNSTYESTFPVIEPMIGSDASKRILSLRDPSKKQSKSDPSKNTRITIRDDPDTIRRKIKKAVTDFTSEVTYDPMERPGVSNLISIHSQVKNVSVKQIVADAAALNTGQYKLVLAEDLVQLLDPIRLQIDHYLKDPDYLMAVLKDGRDKAAETAAKTMTEVRKHIGTIQV